MSKRPHYDKRMGPFSNFKWKVWRPFLCWLLSHKITCYRVVCTYPKPNWYSYICHRCMEMTDHNEPCGTCDNGCHNPRPIIDWRDNAEEGEEGEEGEGLEFA